MKKARDEIYDVILKIVKDNYEKNYKNIPWSGMHNVAVDQILKVFKEKT